MKESTQYTRTHTHSTLDREATVIIAAQSIQKEEEEEVIVRNHEIYNKRMGRKGQAIGE